MRTWLTISLTLLVAAVAGCGGDDGGSTVEKPPAAGTAETGGPLAPIGVALQERGAEVREVTRHELSELRGPEPVAAIRVVLDGIAGSVYRYRSAKVASRAAPGFIDGSRSADDQAQDPQAPPLVAEVHVCGRNLIVPDRSHVLRGAWEGAVSQTTEKVTGSAGCLSAIG